MHVRAQLMMVMALDKCLGCHTCSVTCKQAWTNRDGTDYIWFNNVETKPGVGYPRRWEDQGPGTAAGRSTAPVACGCAPAAASRSSSPSSATSTCR